MSFKQWLEATYDPDEPSSIPDGRFYAIKLRNGKIVYFTDADNHYDVILRSRAAHKNIVATGWMDWGTFFAKPWGDPFQFRNSIEATYDDDN